jgi:hypothetical protein
MGNKRCLSVLLLAVLLTATACSTRMITGSGNLVTEARQVSGFDRIDLSGSGTVIVTQGAGETLTIETDDNILEYVLSNVENGTLKLGFKSGINIMDTTRLVFNVGVDDLTSLGLSGSGSIEVDKLETDHLDVDVSGSGNVQISELIAGRVKLYISGSGIIDLTGDVPVQDVSVGGESVTVSVSGSGNATVCATETLDADVSGSGSVNYYGQPSSVHQSVSGSGAINNLGEK